MSKAQTLARLVSLGNVLEDGTIDAAEIGDLTLPAGGDIVGTTSAQTLTGKTIAYADNTLIGVLPTTGNAVTATTATNQSGGAVNATTGSFSSNVTVSGITNVGNYINRSTGSGNTAWLQQDGTGRTHWYWNTYGTGSPTFTNANEDATAISMHNGSQGTVFFRYASGSGKAAGDPITWTTTLNVTPTTITYKGVNLVTDSSTSTLTNKTLTDPKVVLGGTNGTAGQIPVSQGAGLPPAWVTPESGFSYATLLKFQ